jgi:hypothetical protein
MSVTLSTSPRVTFVAPAKLAIRPGTLSTAGSMAMDVQIFDNATSTSEIP